MVFNMTEFIFFSSFILFILLVLLFDLGVFSRKDHIIKVKEAMIWSVIWIAFAFAFYFFLKFQGHLLHGIESVEQISQKITEYMHPVNIEGLNFEEALGVYNNNLSLEYITGYLIEKSLSVDNIFVIIMIFYTFNVRPIFYKRVLFWGVLGALIMRFIFIFLSSALIQKFDWILYIFGGLLIFTGVKMFLNRNKEEKIDPQHHPVVKLASKVFKVFPRYVGHNFFIRRKGVLMITPLFIVLLVVEFSDLIFAVDSIPAIFSITKDPYIVFFSNIFAIMGLRSLFFVIMRVVDLFHYLKIGLSVLLSFIGIKMLLHSQLKAIGFTTEHSLYIILFILGMSVIMSIIFPKKKTEPVV
jgi:tellurite resistance protein TerC